MKRYKRTAGQAIVVIGVIGVYLSTTCAQNIANNLRYSYDSLPISEHARTTNILSNMIILRVTVGNHPPIEISQLEGRSVSIRKAGIWIYEFVPHLIDQNSERVAISVNRINIDKKHPLSLLEAVEGAKLLTIDRLQENCITTGIESLPDFKIQVVRVQKEVISDKKTLEYLVGDYPKQCCVSCAGLETCACKVSAVCGSCCHSSCC